MTTNDIMFRIITNGTEHKIRIRGGLDDSELDETLANEFQKVRFHHELLKNDMYLKHCLHAVRPYCFNSKSTVRYKDIIISNDKTLIIQVHRF